MNSGSYRKDGEFTKVRFPKKVKINYVRILIGKTDEENYLLFSGKEQVNGAVTKEVDIAFKLKYPFRFHTYGGDRPRAVHLHSSDAETFLTILDTNPKKLEFQFWRNNNPQLVTDAGLTLETLIAKSEKNRVAVNNVIRTFVQSMAFSYAEPYPTYEESDSIELVRGDGE